MQIMSFHILSTGEVAVYSGEPDGHEELEAILDPKRGDFKFQVGEYVSAAVIEATEIH